MHKEPEQKIFTSGLQGEASGIFNYAVITACLNSARTLQRTIDSIFRQSVAPAEFIFVDGGSNDGTLDIIRGASEMSSRVGSGTQFKVIDQGVARGITSAWNIGLRHVTAQWVFILNSDDWYEPNCAEIVRTAAIREPEVEIVAAGTTNFRRSDNIPAGHSINRPNWVMPFAMAYVHPACFVLKTVYDKFGTFNEAYQYCADYEFLYRCQARGARILKLQHFLVNFEMGGAANSHRAVARREMYEIGRRYAATPILPTAAFFLRSVLGR